MKLSKVISLVCLLVLCAAAPMAQTSKPSFNKYHQPSEVTQLLRSWTSTYPQLTKLITIGKSPGGSEMVVIRLAGQPKGSSDPDVRPAAFVSANVEGVHLIGTEAALTLVDKLLTGYGSDKSVTSLLDARTVYVAPLLNPDAAAAYFAPLKFERSWNSRPVDEDVDGKADEDGPDDLNKDGLITQMRVKDPEGTWIPDPKEPRLMRLADPKKGEKGIYKIYAEGLDNDGDGEINEDAEGGVEINRNFPHDFEHNVKTAGLFPVSEPETEAVIKFLTSRTNIAMVLNFSTENTILNMQQSGQVRAGGEKIKVPERYTTMLGLDKDTEYTAKELAGILSESPLVGGMEITEQMVLQIFGSGPVMALDKSDVPIFEAIQKEYKEALKAGKIEDLDKKPKAVGKGSFAAYCYYQYGVPVFSTNLWAVPEPKTDAKPEQDQITAEKLKSMTNDQFLALSEDKINSFLKEQGAPASFNASMLFGMVKSGQITPAKMSEMMDKMPKKAGAEGEDHPDLYLLKYYDTVLKGKGFVNWTPFKHPTLGDVEIGGFIPYLKVAPPPEDIKKTLDVHADFYIKLMGKLPDVGVAEAKVKALGEDFFRVSVFFTNRGWLPTSTAQGRRSQTAWPIRVTLISPKDGAIFSGRPIENIDVIDGSGGVRKLEWTVRGKKGSNLKIKAWSPRLGTVEKTIVLE